jgi:glutamine synthetase
MGELDAYGEFFSDLYDACDQQGLPLDSSLAETGPAQFEVNLFHQSDIVRAADHAILLRRAIKGVAAKHGLLATFMAKPFGQLAGNGLHVHMSLLDESGANVFDDGSSSGSPILNSAIAGLIATAPEAMIFFAPHLNSMRRYQDSSHAPTRATWGYDNRTAAIRVPADQGKNRRFEHRVPGADANPYLVLAAILCGVLHGIEKQLVAPSPVTGNAYEAGASELPSDWKNALDQFARGSVLAPSFGPLLARIFCACKRQEMRVADTRITDFEYDTYLQAF